MCHCVPSKRSCMFVDTVVRAPVKSQETFNLWKFVVEEESSDQVTSFTVRCFSIFSTKMQTQAVRFYFAVKSFVPFALMESRLLRVFVYNSFLFLSLYTALLPAWSMVKIKITTLDRNSFLHKTVLLFVIEICRDS